MAYTRVHTNDNEIFISRAIDGNSSRPVHECVLRFVRCAYFECFFRLFLLFNEWWTLNAIRQFYFFWSSTSPPLLCACHFSHVICALSQIGIVVDKLFVPKWIFWLRQTQADSLSSRTISCAFLIATKHQIRFAPLTDARFTNAFHYLFVICNSFIIFDAQRSERTGTLDNVHMIYSLFKLPCVTDEHRYHAQTLLRFYWCGWCKRCHATMTSPFDHPQLQTTPTWWLHLNIFEDSVLLFVAENVKWTERMSRRISRFSKHIYSIRSMQRGERERETHQQSRSEFKNPMLCIWIKRP